MRRWLSFILLVFATLAFGHELEMRMVPTDLQTPVFHRNFPDVEAKPIPYFYNPFSNLISRIGATQNNDLYCGEQYDSVLGLYYNRARYLNTDSGQFWTMDPFEERVSHASHLHKYLYGNVDPVNNADPTGLVTLKELQIGQCIRQIFTRSRIGNVVMEACKARITINSVASIAFYNQLILLWTLAAIQPDYGVNAVGGVIPMEARNLAPDSLVEKAGIRIYSRNGILIAQLAFDYKDGTRARFNFNLTTWEVGVQAGENVRLDRISVCGYDVVEIALTWRIGFPRALSIGLEATILKYGKFQTRLFGTDPVY
jgi:RHS repeat-associated protein